MDFAKIKHLVKENGDKFIFLEHGEPEIVVLSFHEYQKLLKGTAGNPMMPVRREEQRYRAMPARSYSPDYLESFGGDLEETEFISPDAEPGRQIPTRPEDIRLEDLPI